MTELKVMCACGKEVHITEDAVKEIKYAEGLVDIWKEQFVKDLKEIHDDRIEFVCLCEKINKKIKDLINKYGDKQ